MLSSTQTEIEDRAKRPSTRKSKLMSSFDFVIIGGGIGAGYLARDIAPTLAAEKKTLLIISSAPPSLTPMERPAVSKGSLNPALTFLRNPTEDDGKKFPFACKGAGGPAMPPSWYEETEGVSFMGSMTCTGVDFDSKTLTLSSGEPVTYGKLIIATGSRARALDGCGAEGSTWDELHSEDIDEQFQLKDKNKWGFGSCHTVRDVGDSAKLVAAMERVEDDDQETCYWPVVVVGGGFIAMEVAASIASKAEDLHVTVVLSNEHFLGGGRGGKPGVFNKDMSEFYERQMSQRFGVR